MLTELAQGVCALASEATPGSIAPSQLADFAMAMEHVIPSGNVIARPDILGMIVELEAVFVRRTRIVATTATLMVAHVKMGGANVSRASRASFVKPAEKRAQLPVGEPSVSKTPIVELGAVEMVGACAGPVTLAPTATNMRQSALS